MKSLFLPLIFLSLPVFCQTKFTTQKLNLGDSAKTYRNEFSGIVSYEGNTYLLCQNKQASGPFSGVYFTSDSEIEKGVVDSNYVIPFSRKSIVNLNIVKIKIDVLCNGCYDGLEAICIDENKVYLSVETKDFSSQCFVMAGLLKNNSIVLDSSFLITIPKPVFRDGSRVCNAGFESLAKVGDELLIFFEFNYFEEENYFYRYNIKTNQLAKKKFPGLPFRLTDVTFTPDKQIVGINYFYAAPAGNCETVYRPSNKDQVNQRLVMKNNAFVNNARLVIAAGSDSSLLFTPHFTLPEPYNFFNWEGITAFRSGYLLINDEYAAGNQKFSQLLFLRNTGR